MGVASWRRTRSSLASIVSARRPKAHRPIRVSERAALDSTGLGARGGGPVATGTASHEGDQGVVAAPRVVPRESLFERLSAAGRKRQDDRPSLLARACRPARAGGLGVGRARRAGRTTLLAFADRRIAGH